jgi:lysophospholipase L1-like esterase
VMYPYNMGMNGGVDRFNAIIEELAREHSVRITQMQFSESDFFDGVHLNDAGAENAGRQLSSYILADRGVNESYNAALRVVNG